MRRRLRAFGVCLVLSGTLVAGCSGTIPKGWTERHLASRIDSLAAQAVRDGQPGASVAVATGGKVLLAKGYGFADVTAQVRARATTVYRIASVTKQPGDPPVLVATAMSFDLTPFAGTTVRPRVAEVDNLSMFQAAVDAVRVTSEVLR